jgi:hypothetical protein
MEATQSPETLKEQAIFLRRLRDKRIAQKASLDKLDTKESTGRALKVSRLAGIVDDKIDLLRARHNHALDLLQNESAADERLKEAEAYLAERARKREEIVRIKGAEALGLLSPSEAAYHKRQFEKFVARMNADAKLVPSFEQRTVKEEIKRFEQYSLDVENFVLTLNGPNGKETKITDRAVIFMILTLCERASYEQPMPATDVLQAFIPDFASILLPPRIYTHASELTLNDFLVRPLKSADAKLKSRLLDGPGKNYGFYIKWHDAADAPKRRFGIRMPKVLSGDSIDLTSVVQSAVKDPKRDMMKMFAEAICNLELRVHVHELPNEDEVTGAETPQE